MNKYQEEALAPRDHRSEHEKAYCARVEELMAARRDSEKVEVDESSVRWRRMIAWGIPQRIVNAVRAGVEENEAFRILRGVPSGRFSVGVVSGEPGAGKSVAGACWLELKVSKPDCERYGARIASRAYVRAVDLHVIYPRAFREKDAEHADRYEELKWARKLVLDDLGMEPKGDTKFISKLDAFLDHRTSNILPTVITTNLTSKDIRGRYGDRIASRLTEAAAVVTLEGDYRKAGRRRADADPALPGVA